MLYTLIIFLIVLSVLVFVHELGHFLTARMFGVKSEEFGFGFPPRILGVYKDNNKHWRLAYGKKEIIDASDTIYSINAIPLGGFVKIKGEDDNGLKDKDSFASHPIWQRALILVAGVFMNIVLAAILLSFGFMVGVPQANDDIPGRVQISQVVSGSAAEKAGIKPYDIITRIDGQEVVEVEKTQQLIADASANQALTFKILRGQTEEEFKITPEFSQETQRPMIGVALMKTSIVKYPWYQAIWQGIKMTGIALLAIVLAFYDLFANIFSGHGVGADIGGPIQIAKMTGDVARVGLSYVIQFTALLSLNLAVLNVIPFPALDGGRLLFLLIEKIKGRPVKPAVEAIFHQVGFFLLLVLITLVTYKDILRIFK